MTSDQKYDPSEQDLILRVFSDLLASVTKDGGQKRNAGLKPPWWRDPSHEAAIFSHLNKWKHGELVDPDSGVHPLVHLSWRALAIVIQETYGKRDPATYWPGEYKITTQTPELDTKVAFDTVPPCRCVTCQAAQRLRENPVFGLEDN